jgi:large subunit ribosomal protein L21
MFAVIKTGGHQYKVKQGDKIRIEKLVGEAGEKVIFDDIIMLQDSDKLLTQKTDLSKVKVEAVIKEQTKDAKIIIFKYKRRKNYKRKRGHKQNKTIVEITALRA